MEETLKNVVSGSYRIIAPPGLEGGYYLASISLGTQDVTGQTVSLQPGSPPVLVVYKPNGGTVRGTVDTPGASIILISQEDLDSLQPSLGRLFTARADGSFQIRSLAPGSYYAIALDGIEPAKLSEPNAVRKLRDGAVPVEVTEGSDVSVTLSMVRFHQ